tara:strand:+ start:2908 stop:3738 length:831 start_codon:yes stop_codon:yes gene_type:complete
MTMNQIERSEFYSTLEEERMLRENIRQIIKLVKQKRSEIGNKTLTEREQLINIIQSCIAKEKQILSEVATPDNDPTPNKTTGINVLEDLLKKIIPILEDDYKLLTTDVDQRSSFRAHIVNAVVQALAPVQANDMAQGEGGGGLEEAVEIDVAEEDDEMPPEFIDINKDDSTPEKEVSPEEEFGAGLEGEDETGRNMSYQSFKKIEKAILDAYELLSNADDRELFYDYLLANLKLYFDRFEEELDVSVEEPTNQAYDQAAAGVDSASEEEVGTEFAF